ncbi:MAG: heme NO-binding domain-containing protein [Myxococcota bacterium]
MYGLVNKAIQDFVTREHGPEAWERIRVAAEVDVLEFVCMSPYPDDLTYRLVAAAADELAQPAETVLEGFGEYWIRFSAEEGYGELMHMWGSSLEEFLGHMNDLHARISMVFPELRPPRIRCEALSDDMLALHYESDRPGLAPFVTGLLRGLGKRFGRALQVHHDAARTAEAGHDVFLLHGV